MNKKKWTRHSIPLHTSIPLLRSKMLNVLVCICIIDSLCGFKFVRLACLSSFGWGSWSKCIKRDFHLITPHHHRPREREKRREGNFYVTNNERDMTKLSLLFNGSYILFWLHFPNFLKIKIPLPHDFYIFISMSSYMTNKNWRYVCDGIKL